MSTKKAILQYRIDNNLKQSEMADKINITQASLSQLETGARLPSKDVSLKLINLGVIKGDILFDNSKTVDLFVKKINEVVSKFKGLDLTVSEAVGGLELVKYDLIEENR
jgi:DNA-binding XRE family transcriptional regulator